MNNLVSINSISELHKILGCAPPKHPAISFIKFSEMDIPKGVVFNGANINFYIISLKTAKGKMRYGRNYYDFEEGTLVFTSPNQVLYPDHLLEDFQDTEGWSLFFHPDLLYQSVLSNKMNAYSFFSYDVNEALHLSENEKRKLLKCIENITEEYNQNIDQLSQPLIVNNLELLLNYCMRFYGRQFYTRSKHNKGVITKVEVLLKNYFSSEKPTSLGLPSVKYCAEHVNLSPNYLSDLLKKETGKNTKEHIDYYLLEKAKTLLLSSELNINEIAYDLGFEYPKSFSKLFKKKIGLTPSEYRRMN